MNQATGCTTCNDKKYIGKGHNARSCPDCEYPGAKILSAARQENDAIGDVNSESYKAIDKALNRLEALEIALEQAKQDLLGLGLSEYDFSVKKIDRVLRTAGLVELDQRLYPIEETPNERVRREDDEHPLEDQ